MLLIAAYMRVNCRSWADCSSYSRPSLVEELRSLSLTLRLASHSLCAKNSIATNATSASEAHTIVMIVKSASSRVYIKRTPKTIASTVNSTNGAAHAQKAVSEAFLRAAKLVLRSAFLLSFSSFSRAAEASVWDILCESGAAIAFKSCFNSFEAYSASPSAASAQSSINDQSEKYFVYALILRA